MNTKQLEKILTELINNCKGFNEQANRIKEFLTAEPEAVNTRAFIKWANENKNNFVQSKLKTPCKFCNASYEFKIMIPGIKTIRFCRSCLIAFIDSILDQVDSYFKYEPNKKDFDQKN